MLTIMMPDDDYLKWTMQKKQHSGGQVTSSFMMKCGQDNDNWQFTP